MKTALYWFLAINYGGIPFFILCMIFGVMPMVNLLIVGIVLMTFMRAFKRARAAQVQQLAAPKRFLGRLSKLVN